MASMINAIIDTAMKELAKKKEEADRAMEKAVELEERMQRINDERAAELERLYAKAEEENAIKEEKRRSAAARLAAQVSKGIDLDLTSQLAHAYDANPTYLTTSCDPAMVSAARRIIGISMEDGALITSSRHTIPCDGEMNGHYPPHEIDISIKTYTCRCGSTVDNPYYYEIKKLDTQLPSFSARSENEQL